MKNLKTVFPRLALAPLTSAALTLSALALTSCTGHTLPRTEPKAESSRSFTLLGINDIYRIEAVDGGSRGGMSRLRSLRLELEKEAPDLLLLHAGDLLYPSLLSRRYFGAQMIDILNQLDGDADGFDSRLFITLGNHEFDKGDLTDAPKLRNRIGESAFRWINSSVVFKNRDDGQPWVQGDNLLDTVLTESGGVRIGIYSLTIDSQKADYIEQFLDPVDTARRAIADLRRRGAEVVVGLTHLEMATDRAVLEALGDDGPDLVIGGHEHNRLEERVHGRPIFKADSDARTASIVRVTLKAGQPLDIQHEFRQLGPDQPAKDRAVENRVQNWLNWYDESYCDALKPSAAPDCLGTVVGHTRTELVAEELDIRRLETNFGNWIADQALATFADRGAQIAFMNSGGLRLNQNLPAGSDLTRRHLEELFQYPSHLVLMRIRGSVLQEVIEHAISDWTGNGHFLQIAGFAFRHTPAPDSKDSTGTADRLTLLTPDGPRLVDPDEELLLVVNEFLVKRETGQDGFVMLDSDHVIDTGEPQMWLEDRVFQGLAQASDGIAPTIEGRICTVRDDDPQPCLAMQP